MVRDKNASLSQTCLVCRQKIQKSGLKRPFTLTQAAVDDVNKVKWKVLCAESLCMLFGLPASHPFVSIFARGSANHKGKNLLCSGCQEDVVDVHHVFWQLQNLERKLTQLQHVFHERLRWNYDAIPVATVFSSLGEEDVARNLSSLNYDEIVKVLFERIKEAKPEWPKSAYSSRWKLASLNAEKTSRKDLNQEPILTLFDNLKTEESQLTVAVEGVLDPLDTENDPLELHDDFASPPGSPEDFGEEYKLSGAESKESSDEDSTKKQKKKVKPKIKKGARTKSKAAKKTKSPDASRFLCTEDPDTCTKSYTQKKHLRVHIKTFHKDRVLACPYEGCTMRFAAEKNLRKHTERTHEKKKNTEVCDTCGVEVPRGDLKRHMYLRHLGIGKYTCERCSMDFNEPEELQQHEKLHEKATYPFQCVECEKLFTNSLDLKSHVSGNHLSSGLKCPVCGIMKPNDFLLQRHIKIHERTKKFPCHCGKAFSTKAYLVYHQEHFHNAEEQRQYACSECGKLFLHKKNVLRHMISHSEEKPHKCKICSKTFNYSHLLKKHEEIHSGTHNYGCEICGKRFRQEQNLRQHMKSHMPKTSKRAPKKAKVDKGAGKDELESVPIILEVKGEGGMVVKVDNDNIADTPSVTRAGVEMSLSGQESTPAPVPTQFEAVREVELTVSQASLGTATVVFVAADHQNINWLQ